jgi:hypothetical protein
MSSPAESFDDVFEDMLDRASKIDVASDDATRAFKNLNILSQTRAQLIQPRPTFKTEPNSAWGKVKAGAASVWESETTRALIKAGGAFAGVGLVVWSTVHRDHVLEKQAMQQANQRPS